MGTDSLLADAGWKVEIALTAGSSTGADGVADFHTVAGGESFGNPSRGIVAVVARAGAPDPAAAEAVQIAVHQFIEGLFAAPSTLSGGRAAERALSAVNAWLYAQPRDQDRALSLSAVVLSNRRVGVVHVGRCVVWRLRKGEVTRLTASHTRRLDRERVIVTRALGAEPDIRIDYVDAPVEIDDRFLLLSVDRPHDMSDLQAPFPDVLGRFAPSGGAVLIDVKSLPTVGYDDLAAGFSNLPLRPPPRDGDVWDGFEISGTLYRSRWTVLKVARDTIDGGEVVLKIPLPAMLHDTMFRNGFLREAWVGRLVNSPWVSKPIELPPDRRTSLYLVMPYYRGESLAKRIVREPPLGIVESVDIVLKLCAGAQSLLNQQIVHRDIKPENVVLSPGGGVTLLDLGMAYLPAVDGPLDEGIGGSTHYMAPELFSGQTADARTEVFALGVTLFRMISGDYPFTTRDASPPPAMPRHTPVWLGRALLQALSPDPSARPACPADFARALEEGLVRGDPAPVDGRRLKRKFTPLDGWRAAAIVLAAALLLLLAHDLGVKP